MPRSKRSPEERLIARAKWQREWCRQNPDKVKQINRKQYDKNREKYCAISSLYRKKNKTSVRAYQREYYRKNPGIASRSIVRRQARLASVIPHNYNSAWVRSYYVIARRVSKCLGIKFHVDHIKPVSRGGLHHHDNLQILPAVVNIRKHNFIPEDVI